MKKGLRPIVWSLKPQVLHSERSPDEEGIKTSHASFSTGDRPFGEKP